MRVRAVKWIVALTASGVLHAGAAALLLPEVDAVRIAGGTPTEIVVAGNAFIDQIAAGEADDAVQPAETAVSPLEPVEAETTAPGPVEVASPVEPALVVEPEPLGRNLSREAERSPDVEIAEAPVAAKSTERAKAASVQAAPVEEAQAAEVAVALAVEATEPQRAETAARSEAVEPAGPKETVTAPADVPVPTPRPDYEPPKQAKVEKLEPQKARRAVRKVDLGGKNQVDSRRGIEDGSEHGKATQRGQGLARLNAPGNAAVSNYPGQVVRRLRRALRYPAEAKRERLEGEVHVSFTVSRDGGVGSIRVVRSSGSRLLDEAAVNTVRRAAPFPDIPTAAGRSSWPFTVPLAFAVR